MDERRRFIYTKKEIQKNETIFFQELKTQLASVGINYLHTEAMSDGTLNLTYYGMQKGILNSYNLVENRKELYHERN